MQRGLPTRADRPAGSKKARTIVPVFLFALALALLCVPLAPVRSQPAPQGGAPVAFTDDTFDLADWNIQAIPPTDADSSFLVEQILAGGRPGAFLRTVLRLADRPDFSSRGVAVAYLRVGAVYDPAQQGRIDRIDYAFNLIDLGSTSSHAFPPHGALYLPLILQNGLYYQSVDTANSSSRDLGVWASRSFTAAQWVRFGVEPGPPVPDFSASGAPIQFGLLTGVGWSHPLETASGIDNWSVTIHPGGGGGGDGPDLTGSWQSPVKITCTPRRRGMRCTLEALTVQNAGNRRARQSVAEFYLSQDGVFGPGDVKVGSKTIAALRPGASRRYVLRFNVPAGVDLSKASGLTLIAVLDARARVTETNEGNNAVASAPLP
jgi:hypothetical protein